MTIISDLALLTGQEVLENETTSGFTEEQREQFNRSLRPQYLKSWSKLQSDIGEYANLVEGEGYSFNAISSPVDAVAHANTPLLPLLIQIVPPRYYPTGQTRTLEIPSPQNAEVRLEGFTEAIRRREFNNDPRNPRFAGVSRRVGRIINATPDTTITVEVPELTPQGAEAQVERSRSFLQNTHDRYRAFQEQGRKARRRLEEKNTTIREDKPEVADPSANNAHVARARQEQVSGDLDYLRQQAEQLLDLPPLFMYVNPSTFSLSHEFIVSDGNKTRNGHTVEFWGEQLPTLSLSGEVGAFWTDYTNARGEQTGGLSLRYRKGSYAYQNFLSLFAAYRNNGYLFTQENQGAVRIATVGSVNLFYDGSIYTGSFDSLSITHEEDKPFSLSYQMQFTVRFLQDLRDSRGP